MATTFSSHLLYMTYLQFPTSVTISPEVKQNPKFWPFFHDVLDAINNSHIPIVPPHHIHLNYQNCKGFCHKMPFSSVTSIYSSYAHLQAGSGQSQMLESMTRPSLLIWRFQLISILLLILATLYIDNYLFPIMEFNTILLNRVV